MQLERKGHLKDKDVKDQLRVALWNSTYVKESSEMYLLGVHAFDFNNTTHIIPLLLLHAPVNKRYNS